MKITFYILKMSAIFNKSSSKNKTLVWSLKWEKEKILTQHFSNLLIRSILLCFGKTRPSKHIVGVFTPKRYNKRYNNKQKCKVLSVKNDVI